eukprot:2800797-Pyramimonas_sp.AAC.1
MIGFGALKRERTQQPVDPGSNPDLSEPLVVLRLRGGAAGADDDDDSSDDRSPIRGPGGGGSGPSGSGGTGAEDDETE